MCNEIPTFTNPDRATKNRVKVIPFLSTWVRNAPKDPEEQYATRTFQMDEHFESRRLPFLKPAFLWLMKEYYPIYSHEKLEDPHIIKEYTDKYWQENDIYYQYVTERLCNANTPDGEKDHRVTLTLTRVYNDFRMFMQDNYPSAIVPDRKQVRVHISEQIGPLRGRAWGGVRFQQHMADVPTVEGKMDMDMSMGGLPINRGMQGISASKGQGVLGM